MKKIAIGFDFHGQHYNAAIRVIPKTDGNEFHITVLDGKLERLLYGNHIIKETAGVIQADAVWANKEQSELKLIIAAHLGKYLKKPCFADDICVNDPLQCDDNLASL